MKIFHTVLAVAAVTVAYSGVASALSITPTTGVLGTTRCEGPGTGNDPAWVAANCSAMAGTTEYYKQDQGGGESGPLAGSYTSTFNADLSGGTITWTPGTNYFVCSATSPCWLLVKDGNATPGRYAFDLSLIWDGQETLNLSGFWPGSDQGAISHWAIWGKTGDCCADEIPEPGTLALLGVGLLGLGASRRRRWFA